MKINSMVVEIDGIDKEILRFLMMHENQSFKSQNKIGISGAAPSAEKRAHENAIKTLTTFLSR
jgi:hypothetical protein